MTPIQSKVEEFEELFMDKGDERYGWVKHNNTIIQSQIDWLTQALTETTNESRREGYELALEGGKKIAYELVKEFRDDLITIAIENVHLRGCVTSNQINDAFDNFQASTHKALTHIAQLKETNHE